MAESATNKQVTIKILVDEEKNRVVFAQAGKDFVDVLLSFLTLPLGTIARLVSKESNINKVSVGSLSSLYESVANLDVEHFWTETCVEMLLQPRNPMEAYCRNLKLNIDDTENMKCFICKNWRCSRQYSPLLTTSNNKRCKCGKLMNREISFEDGVSKSNNEGFIPDMATFIVSDDLNVMPDNFQNTVFLLKNLGYENFHGIKAVTVNVTQLEMADLLKCSLLSETPLTDVFLRNKHFSNQKAQPRSTAMTFNIGESEAKVGGEMIKLKVMINKSNGKILFAFAEEDFVDFVFSFLAFPLGEVEHMLKGKSSSRSMDNLYKSVVDFDDVRCLRSPDLKDKLVNSRLAQFKLQKQLLPIDEVSDSNKFCGYSISGGFCGYLTGAPVLRSYLEHVNAQFSYLAPQSLTVDAYSSCGARGFVKRPSMYMVTDDLVVTPASSVSAISFLTDSGISPSDLEERHINIGKKEGLSLLKASLISSSALTNGLSQLIKSIKEENNRN